MGLAQHGPWIEGSTIFPDCPAHPGHLVGHGNGGLVVPGALLDSKCPTLQAIKGFSGFGHGLGPNQYGAGAVDNQHSEVLVSSFADSTQPSAIAAGTFQRGDAEPGREVAPGLEVTRGAGTRDQGSAGQQSDTWNLPEQGDVFVVPGQGGDLPIGEFHLFLQVVDLGNQLGEHQAKAGGEVVLIEDAEGMALGCCRSGRDGMPKFSEATAKSVNSGRASRFPLLAQPMELLDLLLIDESHWNRMNSLAAVGVEQGLGVGLVGLVPKPVLSDELSWQNDRFVTQRCSLPTPEMRTATSLEQHDGSVGLGEELLELLPRQPQMRKRLSLGLGDGDLEDILCEIDGDEITLAHGLLLSWDIHRLTPECWHIAMPEKTREESISSLKCVPRFALHRTRLTPRRLA